MANLRYPLSPGRGDFIMFVARKYNAGGVEIGEFGLTTNRLGGEVANIVSTNSIINHRLKWCRLERR